MSVGETTYVRYYTHADKHFTSLLKFNNEPKLVFSLSSSSSFSPSPSSSSSSRLCNVDFYEETLIDLAKGKAYTRYIEMGGYLEEEKKKEEERKIMLKYYDWIEPSYEKPKGVKISREEREEEDEFYRENPDAPSRPHPWYLSKGTWPRRWGITGVADRHKAQYMWCRT